MPGLAPENSHPRLRRWLILLTSLLTLFQIGSAMRVLQLPGDLAGQISLSLPLELAASLVWALVFGWLTLTLVQNKEHALGYSGWGLVAFVIYSVARLLIFAQADYDRQRLPFALAAAVILSAILNMALLRPARKRPEAEENTRDGGKPEGRSTP